MKALERNSSTPSDLLNRKRESMKGMSRVVSGRFNKFGVFECTTSHSSDSQDFLFRRSCKAQKNDSAQTVPHGFSPYKKTLGHLQRVKTLLNRLTIGVPATGAFNYMTAPSEEPSVTSDDDCSENEKDSSKEAEVGFGQTPSVFATRPQVIEREDAKVKPFVDEQSFNRQLGVVRRAGQKIGGKERHERMPVHRIKHGNRIDNQSLSVRFVADILRSRELVIKTESDVGCDSALESTEERETDRRN